MTKQSLRLCASVSLAFALFACADEESDAPDSAVADAGADAAFGDTGADDVGANDVGANDVGTSDASGDTSDVSLDAAADASPDTTADAALDAAVDVTPNLDAQDSDVVDADAVDGATTAATWAEVEDILFSQCAACHYSEPAGLSLAGGAYDRLVSVPSTQAPSMFRIAPGEPSESYLWRKVEGTHADVGSGNRMPQGGALSADDLETIRSWIEAGAMP